ncbi:MAG: hypothetical protein HOH95_00485 [Dehalococcoidia bacterium]|jgi:methionine sulfoxide reductase heme-binding subunit|nr:hypothetical protein [Dehalococcoidia bacterium]
MPKRRRQSSTTTSSRPTNTPPPTAHRLEASTTATSTFAVARTLLLRNAAAVAVGLAVAYLFWTSRPLWDPEMRLWKSVGDASLILLYATLIPGPLARLAPRTARLIPWRRELGIWFGVFALVHTFLILDGWARWSLQRLLGYEFIPELDRYARLEPGFGLANLIGIAAVLITIALLATSTDWALHRLGASAWKFLHNSVYIIFWLILLHTAYFLFIHYSPHFHRLPPPPDWFRYPFLILTLGLIALQTTAFINTIRLRKLRAPA